MTHTIVFLDRASVGAGIRAPAFPHAWRDYDATDRLREIRVPTLILHGTSDRIAPYELAEKMHAAIQGSKMVTFDGGHHFMFSQQAQFLGAVVEFLELQKAKSSYSC